jgi:serine/threonine protein phosphatase PrpC
MRTHPRKNVVTEALQTGKIEVKPYCYRCELGDTDRFLICCDGVWEALSQESIENRVATISFTDAANQLCDEVLALQR